ncbi:SDR family NAD(P)-dependent oxidoreductase [Acidipila sp. EB88]|uniref:SDR family NAD(P)-dependent oxidoreductase n=1 Tax=Acidipila sp. EB88 TaxID=2305226 RepID=UPI000F60227E|nr:glucose 1-dehydrogenase [Acidipila sp. EB88]RRA49942.1 SDR family oxidoreductase [Acidipila sp. EB88]
MGKLSGKIALVTGASKGIGQSIARLLGAEGATVVVNYATSREGAEQTVAEITSAGGEAWLMQGDFSNHEDITRTFAEIRRRHGRLHVLVNNAGIAGFGPLEQVTGEEFHRLFNLNVLGLVLSMQAAVPLMVEGGSVINIGSLGGSMPSAYGSIYSATKGAVNNLSISLSKELGPKQIRVNALNPGLTITEGLQASGFMQGERYEAAIKATPLGRAGQPDDIARIAVFLASDDAFWVTGQVIQAAGGITL